MADERLPTPEEILAANQPFKVTKTQIECPFDDGEMLDIEIGWQDQSRPVLHINAPALVEHLNEKHEGRY